MCFWWKTGGEKSRDTVPKCASIPMLSALKVTIFDSDAILPIWMAMLPALIVVLPALIVVLPALIVVLPALIVVLPALICSRAACLNGGAACLIGRAECLKSHAACLKGILSNLPVVSCFLPAVPPAWIVLSSALTTVRTALIGGSVHINYHPGNIQAALYQ